MFTISNEKMIFEVIQQASKGETPTNQEYFVIAGLSILKVLLDTLQVSKLLQNEEEYLDFLNPYLKETKQPQPIKLEAFQCFKRIVSQMRDQSF